MNREMPIEQFRTEYNQELECLLSNGYSGVALSDTLTTWFDIYWSRLPYFNTNSLVNEIDHQSQIPAWYHGNWIRSFTYKNNYYFNVKLCEAKEIYITPDQAIGHTWLYSNNRTEGRPLPERLSKIVLGSPEVLPSIYATKAGNYYLCNDGNHRIYAAYLLGKKVKVKYYEEYSDIFDEFGKREN